MWDLRVDLSDIVFNQAPYDSSFLSYGTMLFMPTQFLLSDLPNCRFEPLCSVDL